MYLICFEKRTNWFSEQLKTLPGDTKPHSNLDISWDFTKVILIVGHKKCRDLKHKGILKVKPSSVRLTNVLYLAVFF